VVQLSFLRVAHGLGTAGLIAITIMVTAPPGLAQEGPIRLFPEQAAPPWAESSPEETGSRIPAPVERGIAPGTEPPAPEPAGELTVEGLAAPELDAIGLSGPAEGGFDRPLWDNSDPELVMQLLADLPVLTRVPPLRDLTRRLLVSGSAAGESEPGRMLAMRIDGLVAMGELDAAKALVDHLPPPATDSHLARRAAEVALLLGDDQTACRLADSLGPTSGAEFWGKAAVFCRLVEDDAPGAQLGLDLMREAGQTTDDAFFELATAIADGLEPPPLPRLVQPSAIHLALLSLAQWPLPQPALADAPPYVLAAVAREPALAAARQLPALEQAFLLGATSADRVAAGYAEADPAVPDVMPGPQSEWDAQTRAAAFAAVLKEPDPVVRAELLDTTWRASRGAERFLIAEVLAEPFVELPVERYLAAVAPSVARALLAVERPVPAVSWLSLLTTQSGQDARSQPAEAGLVPLFALAGVGGSDAVPRIDAAAIEAWQLSTTADAATTERLFALLEGVGAPIEADPWRDLLPAHAERQAVAPAAALWRGLERAAAERRVGETVLYALHMLDGRPEEAHPEALTTCLRALSRVGLDRDARAIAVATALIQDL
jgi:hypothetical protein